MTGGIRRDMLVPMENSPSTSRILVLLALLPGCSCGKESGDADADADIDEVAPAHVADMPGDALSVATDWTTAVVCGMDFALAIDLETGDAGVPVALATPCSGVAVDGTRAAVVDRLGTLIVLDVGAGGAMTEVDRDENLAAVYEDVLLDAGTAYVAARSFGILRFDASGGTLSALPAWTEATDARAIIKDGNGFAVGDGEDGARLLDADGAVTDTVDLPDLTSGVEGPDGRVDVTLPYEGESIAVSDSWIVVGSGGFGYEWRARGGGEVMRNSLPFFHEGPVFDVAIDGAGGFVYAEGGSIRRMAIAEDGTLSRNASEYRADRAAMDGGWWVDLASRDGEALLLATDALFRTDLPAHVPAPDLDVDKQSMFALAAVGATSPASMTLRNYGDLELTIAIDSMSAGTMDAYFMDLAGLDVPDETGTLRLPPAGPGGAVQVDFTPTDDAPVEGVLTFVTNDLDEATMTFPVHGNPAELGAGDDAPDFMLTTLDGTTFRRSEHEGDVLLLMFFNST